MHTELKPAFDSSSQMVLLKQAHLLTDKCSPPGSSWAPGGLDRQCLIMIVYLLLTPSRSTYISRQSAVVLCRGMGRRLYTFQLG